VYLYFIHQQSSCDLMQKHEQGAPDVILMARSWGVPSGGPVIITPVTSCSRCPATWASTRRCQDYAEIPVERDIAHNPLPYTHKGRWYRNMEKANKKAPDSRGRNNGSAERSARARATRPHGLAGERGGGLRDKCCADA
jgi:hypothetical protein